MTELKDRILAEKEGAIGWITFNHPERRNAMTLEMWQAFGAALADFQADDAIRVVVMKGSGGKAFVSGGDISQFEKSRNNAEAAAVYAAASEGAREQLASFQKPLIAMVKGFCLGGGMAVALKADFRIASMDSQFGIPAAKRGIAYNVGGLKSLMDLVGPGVTKKMLFTGRRYSALEALQMGIIEEAVPPENLEAVVRSYAETIASNAPLSIRATKLTVDQILKDESKRDPDLLTTLSTEAFNSDDYKEGRRAFMEKRTPQFTGR